MACPDTPVAWTCFFEADAAVQSLLFMNNLRKQAQMKNEQNNNSAAGGLCDARLLVNGRLVLAHKVVLAASSQYFADVLTDPAASVLSNDPIDVTSRLSEAERIDTDSFDALLDYAYTKRVLISEANVHALFQAADCLRFGGVKVACFKFLQRLLGVDNCITMWLFAMGHGNKKLAVEAMAIIEQNFESICHTSAFLELSAVDLVKILSQDDLCVMGEEVVYESAIRWMKHNPALRQDSIGDVMQSVRLQLLAHDYLLSLLENEPAIQNDLKCIPQLIAAIEYKVQVEGREAATLVGVDEVGLVKPRRPCLDVEEMTINRATGSQLGVAVMGGSDRAGHVFYRGSKPGIRVTHIYSDGAAATSNLCVGDHILSINGRPTTHLQHDQAIALIAKPSDHITLLVRHARAPPGLLEFTLSTNRGLGFGLSIEGGANAPSGNPADPDDDGIFVSQVLPGGAADQCGKLKVGQRIIQVNSLCMLGVTHAEALQAMRQSVDRLHLMVCDGFDPDLLPKVGDSPESRRKCFEAAFRSCRPAASVPEYSTCVPF